MSILFLEIQSGNDEVDLVQILVILTILTGNHPWGGNDKIPGIEKVSTFVHETDVYLIPPVTDLLTLLMQIQWFVYKWGAEKVRYGL